MRTLRVACSTVKNAAAQGDRLEVEQVAGHDAFGLGFEELLPGRTRPAGRGVQSRGLQDRPDCRGSDLVAETGEFTLYPAVAPSGVVQRRSLRQGPRAGRYRRPTRPTARAGGPSSCDQAPVPAQERPRRPDPPCRRQPQRQRRDHRAVRPAQPRASHLPLQHRELMAQQQDLDLLGYVRTSQQNQPANHTVSDQVPQVQTHAQRSCQPGQSVKPTAHRPHAGLRAPTRLSSETSIRQW